MRLRTVTLIVTLALGLLAALVSAEGQKPGKLYRIGILESSFLGSAGFRGLQNRLGWLKGRYVEGRDYMFENPAAVTDDRLPGLADELVRLPVDIIVAAGAPAIWAAQRATKTIPIVILSVGDPVRAGFVASLDRPGGNITGIALMASELIRKRLQLLREAVPGFSRVGVLWNPADPSLDWREIKAVTRGLGVTLEPLEVRGSGDLEPAFDAARRAQLGALMVLGSRLTYRNAGTINGLAMDQRLPAIFESRAFVDPYGGSGLMSYGHSNMEVSERLAAYVDKILKGAKPADLPVWRPLDFELVINMRTAKALGLTIPSSLLMRADKVIE